MIVFPAVDILDGNCVQLVQGDRNRSTVYGKPLECAHRWLDEGADALHIVNLNGAFGNARRNAEIIRELLTETGVYIQLGGGIRSIEDAEAWLDIGVDRIIISTLAVENPDSISTIASEYGSERVMAGVDALGGEVVTHGWERPVGNYITWAKTFEERGAGSLLFTNVDVEGLCEGINITTIQNLISHTDLPVMVSGGITTTEDLITLKENNVWGVILGSALYSQRLKLSEVLEVSR
ncbi:MAG: 1-(5-phosphoribosyl)-5-[(5-phosphoribosylamino)methylideneamino]imidazole-4-carboxamide isomerase [Methanospirillaceae archaeon]|nr:1-(5-phosphoribosyl)-5-[(5-phosphoribosylamino)methylideneamino]imidazole-4-carboxamide isomerase [Methanospirillaceae archaeon]